LGVRSYILCAIIADLYYCRRIFKDTFHSEAFQELKLLNMTDNFPCYNGSYTFSTTAFQGLDNLEVLALSHSPHAAKCTRYISYLHMGCILL